MATLAISLTTSGTTTLSKDVSTPHLNRALTYLRWKFGDQVSTNDQIFQKWAQEQFLALQTNVRAYETDVAVTAARGNVTDIVFS